MIHLKNVLSIKWIWVFAVVIFLSSLALSYFSRDVSKTVLSLLNVGLIIVPLFSSIFGITYIYDLRNFNELILSQPVPRSSVLLSEYLAITLVLVSLFFLSSVIPLILLGSLNFSFILYILSISLLIPVFLSLSFLTGVIFDDRVKGTSFTLVLWFYLSFLHDGLILLTAHVFREYPVEGLILTLSVLNPVDLSRLLVVLNLDIGALMGLSGVIFKNFFTSSAGILISLFFLILWAVIPLIISLFIFRRRDF